MLTMFTPGVFIKSALPESPEMLLICILLPTGMNWWFLQVPLNLGEFENLGCGNYATWWTCSVLIKKDVTSWISTLPNSNNCNGVKIWFEIGLWRLAWAARFFMVPPTPSQTFFSWDVAKKFHSAFQSKSCSCKSKFAKFLKFLYCPLEPSLK